MFEQIVQTFQQEFSDLSLISAVKLSIRLLIAALMGGLLGWERERAGKAAGIRTHILVAIGAAAFVAIPQQSTYDPGQISRVLQGLITGVGFLGAGCIMKADDGGHVKGLTTAAGIWLTAAVGVAAGMGRDTSALLLGGFGYVTLSSLGRWEKWLGLGESNPNPPGRKR